MHLVFCEYNNDNLNHVTAKHRISKVPKPVMLISRLNYKTDFDQISIVPICKDILSDKTFQIGLQLIEL